MLFNYNGVNVNQQQVVAKTYGLDKFGRPLNRPGGPEMARRLNEWSIDNSGRPFAVESGYSNGAVPPTVLVGELSRLRPILLIYKTGPSSSHMVVVTGVTFWNTRTGPIINSIIVRDPSPTPTNVQNSGRVTYRAADLGRNMLGYFVARVSTRP